MGGTGDRHLADTLPQPAGCIRLSPAAGVLPRLGTLSRPGYLSGAECSRYARAPVPLRLGLVFVLDLLAVAT
jgi:hypothetical protein